MSERRPSADLRVAIVGHGFMAEAHVRAWRLAPQAFDLPTGVSVVSVAGRDASRAAQGAAKLRVPEATGDWRRLLERPDIDVVDICTPVDSHAEIALAALDAGKHVLCEKPLGLDCNQSLIVAEAARRAAERGCVAMVGFNYRRVPALTLARRLIDEGRFGRARHVRARYLQDWLSNSSAAWSWRLDAAQAGAGALADLGSHLIDLVHYLLDERLDAVCGHSQTFVTDRRDPRSEQTRAVDVDDTCTFLARGEDDLLANFEVSRVAHGKKNHLTLEVDGERGSLAFDLERLNELVVDIPSDDEATSGPKRILVTEPSHPYLRAWWPPGHVLGWDHTFANQAHDFLCAILQGETVRPTFDDGAYVDAVIDAVQSSTRTGLWHQVATSTDRRISSRNPAPS
jgi:predicted dehydrogenase